MESANDRDFDIERASRDASTSAATQLAELGRLQRPEEGLAPSRGYAALMLLLALIMSSYVALVLLGFGGQAQQRSPGSYPATMLLLAPVLFVGGLSQGARERFGVRVRETLVEKVLWVVLMAAFMVLWALTLFGPGYPTWLSVALPLGIFLLMGLRPIRDLTSGGTHNTESWTPSRLSRAARTTSVLVGVVLAAQLIASALPLAAAMTGIIVMVAFVPMLFSWRTDFGLPNVGYEWGPTQWVCFVSATAVAFVSSLSVVNGASWGWPLASGAAAIVVLVMVIAAFLPTTVRR